MHEPEAATTASPRAVEVPAVGADLDPRTARHLLALAPEFALFAAYGVSATVVGTGGGCLALQLDINDEVYALVTTDDYSVATSRAEIRRWEVTTYDRHDDAEPLTEAESGESLAAAWYAATGEELTQMYGSPLLLVACGARKAPNPAPAAELYGGTYFAECLRAARALADDSDIRIISARHGLVTLAEELEPYDTRIRGRRDQVADLIRYQARTARLLARPVIVLGGRDYVETVRAVWPHAVAPLAGAAIGIQRQRLARMAYPRPR
ncbi:DUF6884 domain-containing protein [Nocardia sp. 004]|uniref:DUF6884 domain-containing protein n=1 Tax=Nocardia sp. 004 TaxID=3385978 RepID=UPI0039A3EA78